MITYREAEKNEISQIARLTTVSFGNYPFFDFALLNAFKRESDYFAYLEKLHSIHIRANMQRHKCFVGVEDGKIVSAALLQHPTKKRISVWDYIRAGAVGLLFPVDLPKILDFFAISEEAQIDCAHQYASSWYLEMLVVDGTMKGRGLGSKMLHDCLIPYIRKQGGKTLTLITNTEQNCRFYQKNGFRQFAVRTLERDGMRIANWSFEMDI